MKNSKGDIVRGNIVHDSYDTNAIYQEYCSGGLIENNLIYNVPGTRPGRGSGIQIDVDSTGARIFNNSIYNVFSGLYLINPATVQYNAIANTTHAVDAKQGGDFAHNVWAPNSVFMLDNQPMVLTLWKTAGHADDIAADPMWTDPARGNFDVPPTSPLISARAGISGRLIQPRPRFGLLCVRGNFRADARFREPANLVRASDHSKCLSPEKDRVTDLRQIHQPELVVIDAGAGAVAAGAGGKTNRPVEIAVAIRRWHEIANAFDLQLAVIREAQLGDMTSGYPL